MGNENPIRTLGYYSKPSHEGYRNTIELPIGNNVAPLRSDTIRLVQNGCSFHELRSKDPNQHLKDFLKLVYSLDLDSENMERTYMHLFQFSFCDQASNWLERLPAGSISGRTTKHRNDILIIWALLKDLALYDNESWNDRRDFAKPVKEIALPQDVPRTSDRRLIKIESQVQRLMEAHLAPTQPTQVNKITTSCEICSGPNDTQYCMEDPKQAFVEYASSRTDERGGDDGEVMFIEIIRKNDDSRDEEPEEEGSTTTEGEGVEYSYMFPTRSELPYHKYLMCGPIPSIILRNPIITKGCPSKLKIPCNIRHVHVEKAYINPKSPLNIMTRMMYNWIMRRKLDPRESSNRGVSNFTGRIKGMHVFVGNFTYVI
ncbi:hypothetical protein Tco_1224967, partial [Tanacetum coccineum]